MVPWLMAYPSEPFTRYFDAVVFLILRVSIGASSSLYSSPTFPNRFISLIQYINKLVVIVVGPLMQEDKEGVIISGYSLIKKKYQTKIKH